MFRKISKKLINRINIKEENMEKTVKLHYSIFTALLFIVCFLLLPYSMADAAYVTGFTSANLCTNEINITYLDADNDNSTGVWVGSTWYPTETQVAVYHIQGDLAMTTDSMQSGYYGTPCGSTAQQGKFVIRFVDATAPGWVWNNPSTWTEKKMKRIQWNWWNGECSLSVPSPYSQAKVYEHWNAGNMIDSKSIDWITQGASNVTVENMGDFSEVYFQTDFCILWVHTMYVDADSGSSPGDTDGDGVTDDTDNCLTIPNGPNGGTCSEGAIGDSCTSNGNCGCLGECSMDQENNDYDSLGDVCDPDIDGDGVLNVNDNCPKVPNGPSLGSCFDYYTQSLFWGQCSNNSVCQQGGGGWWKWCDKAQNDADSDGVGDVCDPTP
jgi:hypothetical protein